MITIFTTAKSFKGEARTRQINAMRSWKALHPDIEVILFGDGDGYKETALELGIRHISGVETTEKGTPLVSSMFAMASKVGKFPVLAYANCDIIFLDDFLKAAMSIEEKRFMMVGQRWDIDVKEEIDFRATGWQGRLRERLKPWNLHPASGSDYFVFRRGTFLDLPPMVVGRAGYDNWLIYHCRVNGVPVIDASDIITAVHQNHDYSHLARGKIEAWSGNEAMVNMNLAGGYDQIFTLVDADLRLTGGGLVKNNKRSLYRSIETYLILRKTSPWCRLGLKCIRAAKPLGHIVNKAAKK